MSKTKRSTFAWTIYACLLLTLANAAWAQTVITKTVAEGMASKLTGARIQELNMRAHKPADIHKLPDGIADPLCGVILLGPRDAPTRFAAVMDRAAAGEPRIWIDTNGNGDLTDDAPIKWTKSEYPSFDGKMLTRYDAFVSFSVHYPNGTVPLRLNLLRFDPKDPNRAAYRDTLLYIADYAREADIPLGAETYHALLYDAYTLGDFRGGGNPQASLISLYIDVNHNGVFDTRGEAYDALHPFNIKGVTYQLTNMSADGSRFDVVKSKTQVQEELPPPDLSVGKLALPFSKPRMDGQTAHFPQDYKGRLVMLYFWASYCPVCQAELPFVRDAYRQFHPMGVDILGVSLDPATLSPSLTDYLAQSHIDWPQIYDTKGYAGKLVDLYYVTLTPTPYLVDGDTGKILAVGNDLRGDRLAPTLQKALAAKKTN